MSKLIEEQVVKMQFDNKGFESGVQQSMSTLDKLKAALHFKDVNLSPLEKAFSQAEATATRAGFHIRDVWLKMSEVFEYQVARKIVSTGEKIAKALTIEGAMDGFNEYELKMGSIQTIMAGTGESLATVNKYLEELNTYSDKTIYSFKDMTDNIGKFTNAGVSLNDAVNAIKGIANEAAVSGANANEASRAMYNFSQALSAGYVKLIDWKSIENANMATKEFKQTLLDTALALGTVVKEGEDYKTTTTNAQGKVSELFNSTKMFNDSLNHQWMTTEVLTQALKVYATDVRELTDAEKAAYEQELKSKGFSDEQIFKFEQLGIKAANAATEIKTFSMLMDTLKEAIGSGWAMTWQYIIGDFEQAKELWTQIGNAVGGVIDKMSDARNSLLKNGLATGWERVTQMTEAAIPATETFRERLTAAAVAQGKLTEEEALQLEKTSDWIRSIREKGWLTKEFFKEQTREYYTYLKGLDDESLQALSIDPKDLVQFDKFIGLMESENAEFNKLFKSMSEMGGRENMLEGLKNIFSGIYEILQRISNAWKRAFGKINADDIYDLTVKFKDFSEKLHLSDKALRSIETVATLVFKALKAGIDIVSTAIKGVSKLVLPILNLLDAVLGVIGEIIAAITRSDGIVGFADKLESGGEKIKNGYLAIMQKIADTINAIAEAIRNWRDSEMFRKLSEWSGKAQASIAKLWDEFKRLPIIQEMMADFNKVSKNVTDAFTELGNKIEKFFDSAKNTVTLENFNNVLTKIYHGLKDFKTILGTVKDNFVKFFQEIKSGKSITESFKDNFGEVIEFFNQLKEGLVDFFDKVFGDGNTDSKFKELGDAIHEFFTTLDADKVSAIVLTTVFGLFAINLLRLTNAMSDAVTAISGTFNTLKMVINSYMKRQKNVLLQIAEAVLIVAGAIYVLSTIDANKLKQAQKALIVISACIAVLLVITTIMTKVANAGMADTAKISRLAEMTFSLVALSGVLVLAAFALKKISELDLSMELAKKATAVVGVIAVLATIAGILAKVKVPGGDNSGIVKISVTLVAIAGALYIVALAMEKVSQVAEDEETIKETTNAMLKMMAGLAAIALAAGSIGGFSALGILAVVVLFEKLMPRIEQIVNYDYSNIQNGLTNNEEILKKIGVMTGIMLVIGGLFGKGFSKMGTGLIKLISVMALLVIVAKYASTLDVSGMTQGITFIESLVSMLSVMVVCLGLYSLMSKLDKGQRGGMGLGVFLGIALTLGAMTLIVKAVKDLDPASLQKGIKFIGVLTLLVDSMFVVAGLAGKSGASSFKSLALILSGVAFILGLMVTLSIIKDKGSLYTSMAAVAVVLLSLGAVFAAVSKVQASAKDTKMGMDKSGVASGPIFIVIMGIAAIIAGMVWLSKQPVENIAAAGTAITIAMIAFAGVLATVGKLNNAAEGVGKKQFSTILFAILGVAAVAGMIIVLSKHAKDTQSMAAAGASIMAGLLGLSACIKALSRVADSSGGNLNWKKLLATIGAAVGALAAVSLAIGLLSNFGGDPGSMVAAATSITIGLVGVAICCTAMGFAGRLCEQANWKTAGEVILGAIGAMGAVAFAISKLATLGTDSKSLIDSALAIGIGTVAIGAASVLMGLAAKIASNANPVSAGVVLAGAIAAIFAIAGSLVWLGNALTPEQADSVIKMAPSFSLVMGAFGVMCIAMAAAAKIGGTLPGLATALLGGIAALIVIVGATIGLGALFEKFEGLEEKMNHGLDAMVNIFTKVGEALGGLIGGFLGTMIGELIAGVGTGLNILMDDDHLGGFFNKVSKVPQKAIDGAKNVAGAVAAWISVGWDQFWASLFGANVDFDKFNFEAIGKMIVGFADSVKDVSESDLEKANIAANIASSIGVLANNLPKSGSIFEIFTGKTTTLEDFGKGLSAFATGIKDFAIKARGLVDEDVANIQRVIQAADIISGFSKTLQSYGGLKGLIFGDRPTIDKFGESIVAFVDNLIKFVERARELESGGTDYPSLIQRVADSVVPLNDLSKNLDRVGGLLAKVIGHSDLKTFSDTFIPFAKNLNDFVTYVRANLDWDFEGYITKVTGAVDPLAELAQKLAEKKETFFGIGTLDLDEFGKQIKKFGEKIAEFCENNQGVDYTPITNISKLTEPLSKLTDLSAELNPNGIANVVKSLNEIAKISLEKVAEAFQNDVTVINAISTLVAKMVSTITSKTSSTVESFKTFGNNVVVGTKTGISNGTSSYVVPAIAAMVTSVRNKLSELTSSTSFQDYGRNVALGLAAGIEAETPKAVAAAQKMADEVSRTTKDALKEKSPSKLSRQYGVYWDQGLALGIGDGTSGVVKTVNTLSDEVISSTKMIIDGINGVLNTDINFEPTIRPVVDTSDVLEKSKEINKMLSLDGTTANRAAASFSSSDLAFVRNVAGSFIEVEAAKRDAQNGADSAGNNDKNTDSGVTFVQNNYSPKALSRMEIYRQTRNQISMVKGVVKGNA